MKNIIAIGDSHVLRFKGHPYFTNHYELIGATAYNMNKEDGKGRVKTFKLLEGVDKNSFILFTLGEIDCRVHLVNKYIEDGILAINECVDNYISFLNNVREKGFKDIIVFAPIASTPFDVPVGGYPTNGSVIDRNHITTLFNQRLKEKCDSMGFVCIDINKYLYESPYLPSKLYYADKIHLKERYQKEFFTMEFRERFIPFKYGGRNRKPSFDLVMSKLDEKGNPVLIEIGQARKVYNWDGDGYSTALFSWYLNQRKDGEFYSVDIDDNSKVIDEIFKRWSLEKDRVNIVQEDGIKFLEEFPKGIDLLYLDAWDYHMTNEKKQEISETMHLKAFKIAESKLNKGALVLIDDIHDTVTYKGKGRLLIPYMLENGYKLLYADYQFLFEKGE